MISVIRAMRTKCKGMATEEVKDSFTKVMKCNFELEYYENTATEFKTNEMPMRDRGRFTIIKFTKASNLQGKKAHLSLAPWNKQYADWYYE
jgi:hypothetical protein